jgi:hypothetical protein
MYSPWAAPTLWPLPAATQFRHTACRPAQPGPRRGDREPRSHGGLDRAVAELAAAASSSAPTPATDYNEGDFHGHIAATRLTLTTRTPDAALAACWHHVPTDRMGRLAQGALRTNFPVPVPSPLPSYTDLNPSQQQLLHALADLQHAWGT